MKIKKKTVPAYYTQILGIHAREWISPASVTYIIKELVENRQNNLWADKMDFYVVPVLNPDGYEYTHTNDRLWRKNRRNPQLGGCAGTDLNRNFGYKWGGLGSSKNPCAETYAGTAAFSEPESKAIRDYVTSQGNKFKVRNPPI
jgi:carboxypeptidase A4